MKLNNQYFWLYPTAYLRILYIYTDIFFRGKNNDSLAMQKAFVFVLCTR
jgi:hypothetical protein